MIKNCQKNFRYVTYVYIDIKGGKMYKDLLKQYQKDNRYFANVEFKNDVKKLMLFLIKQETTKKENKQN